MILSSDTNPVDRSYAHEISGNINVRDTAPPVTSTDVSISRSNIPSINRIPVTHDGKVSSNKAVNYAISLSYLSDAEIALLRIIGNTNEIKKISVDVEDTPNGHDSLKRNIQGSCRCNGRHNKEM